MIKKNYIDFSVPNFANVKLTEMGNIFQVTYQDKVNRQILIKKLNENEYIYLPTGEILTCNHIKNRSENVFQVGQSLKRLRALINTNIYEPKNCRWITLTYAENMTDTKRLYNDFECFIKRLRRKLKAYHIEYIVAMEPQGRGSWHAHLLLIFDREAPYIPNSMMAQLWQQGFTKTKKLVDIDNVGAYLTAYLGDMECTPENLDLLGLTENDCRIKMVDSIDGAKLKQSKKFIKGGRLYLYPPKFNLYRCSRGIKQPTEYVLPYEIVKEKIGSLEPTYTSSFELVDIEKWRDGSPFRKRVKYELYNTKRFIAQ